MKILHFGDFVSERVKVKPITNAELDKAEDDMAKFKTIKESIMPYMRNDYIVVVEHISSDHRHISEEIATIDIVNNEIRFVIYDGKNGCFTTLKRYDDNLEHYHIGEYNEWLTSYASRITKIYAPVKGKTPDFVVKTQKPVWENPTKTPLEYKPI